MIISNALEGRWQAAEEERMNLRRLVVQTSREQVQILRGAGWRGRPCY